MKDLTIHGSSMRREAMVLATVLLIAILMNMYAIVAYGGSWSELLTQLHTVLALAVALYLIVGLFRGIYTGFKKVFSNQAESVD